MNKIAEKALGSAGVSVRALNPHVFGTAAAHNAPQIGSCQIRPRETTHLCGEDAKKSVDAAQFIDRVIKSAKRIRQDSKPLLNKLELNFYAWLLAKYPGVAIWKQALRWKLGNGIWYKPDFAAHFTQGAREGITCWEVKGPHAFRGGFENLKVAASLYPEVRWTLVWKKDGKWQRQEVMP